MANLREKILKYKHFTPIEKLVLITIEDAIVDIPPFFDPARLTCGEIGAATGLSRKTVLDIFWGLTEQNLIESKIISRTRETILSKRLIRMVSKKEKKDGTTETIPRPNTTSTITKI